LVPFFAATDIFGPTRERNDLKPKRTSIQSPWQNGIAERWVGSCRRVILDHVIALNEAHLRRLIRDYVNYYHHDRIHDSPEKDTPTPDWATMVSVASGVTTASPATRAS
jgi:transposase InsO family protein